MGEKRTKSAAGLAVLGLLLIMALLAQGCSLGAREDAGPGPEPLATMSTSCLVYMDGGCDKQVVASGGEIEILSGGVLDAQSGSTFGVYDLTAGNDITATGDIHVGGNIDVTGVCVYSTDQVITGSLTIGIAAEEDVDLTFDGAAQDYYLGLDDGTDDLLIGLGNAVGTTPAIGIDENLAVATYGDITMNGTTPLLTVGDGGEEDAAIVYNGAAQDFYVALDDTADDLLIGLGSAVGTTPILGMDENKAVAVYGDVTLQTGTGLFMADGTGEGVVFAATNTLAYTDVASKTMFVLPANANIVDAMFVVTTLFNGSGTDTLDCGINEQADPDDYVDGLDGESAGVNRLGDAGDMPYAFLGDVGASNVTVVCLYTDQNSNASAGAALLTIWYKID